MPKYLIVNRPPKGYTGSPEAIRAWNEWFAKLGNALIDRGNPCFRRVGLNTNDAATELGGYTLIETADLDAAVALARSCPVLDLGGAVEVGELTELN